MYVSGQLDTAAVPRDRLGTIQDDPVLGQELHIVPRSCTYYYGFSVSEPPFDNALVRKAFAAGVDRRGLISHELGGLQIPALTMTPPGVFGHVDGYAEGVGIPFDSGQARQWLADAGYPNGQGLPPITLWFNTSSGHQAIAEYIRQDWIDNLGVTVELSDLPWDEYGPHLRTGQCQIWRTGWCADYSDAFNMLHDLVNAQRDALGGWTSDVFESLMAQAARASDGATRQALYKEAEEILSS